MRRSDFFVEKKILVPTKKSLLIFLCATMLLVFAAITTIHPFLAKNKPVNGDALIVEGWLSDYCLEYAASLIIRKNYRLVFVTGMPLESGSYLKEYKTYAELGNATLKKLLVPDSMIIVVPAPYSPVDRTYSSAVSLKRWLDSTGCTIRSFDVCSKSTHTRRSELFFKRALGKKYQVGCLAIKDRDYDPNYWWKYSQGVRSVIDETVAYLYALFFVLF